MKQLSQDELMSFSQAVGKLLQEKQFMLASAESCTGGLIGHLITEVSGSSAYLRAARLSTVTRQRSACLACARTR